MDKNPDDDLSDLPELEDFSSELEKIKKPIPDQSGPDIGDYTKPKSDLPKQIIPTEGSGPPKEQKSCSGLKKGFFNQSLQPKGKPPQPIQEIKPDPQAKARNKLEMPEVQAAMNMNNFLVNDKDQWLTPELLKKISENPVLAKLFTNPEYLNAMTLMQKDPKGVMEKYGKNPEFMQLFQEFCKLMGGHFTNLSQQPNKDPNAERIQNIIDSDKEVQEILKDPQIQNLLQFLTTNKKLELNQLMQKNPVLTQKVNVLIKKGIINVQNF